MTNIKRSAETEVEKVVANLMVEHSMGDWTLNVWQRADTGFVEVSVHPSRDVPLYKGVVDLIEAQAACLFVKDFFKLPQGDGLDEPAAFEEIGGHPMRLTVSFTQGCAPGIFSASLGEDRYSAQMGGLLVSLIDEIGTDADAYYLCHAARILGTGTAHAAWVIHGTTNATSDELRRAVDEIMNPPVEQLVELLMQNIPPEVEAALARHSENEFATESQNQAWGTF